MRIAIGDSNQLTTLGLVSICRDIDKSIDVKIFSKCSLLTASSYIPDVVLLDFTSEGFSLDSIIKLKKAFPRVKLLCITPIQSASTVLTAIKFGIDGYVKKDCSVAEIKESLVEVAKGTSFYCGDILRLLTLEGVDALSFKIADLDCEPIALTDRETEILRYISAGNTNSEIADLLFLSSHTVNTHRKNILNKIGAKNTAGAVVYAIKEGILDPERFTFTRN